MSAHIIVSLADESITGAEGCVWVEDIQSGSDLDTEDVVNYASAHGHDVAAAIDLVRRLAEEIDTDDKFPLETLEAFQDYIDEARALLRPHPIEEKS
jgi:type III secretory pathway component EscU